MISHQLEKLTYEKLGPDIPPYLEKILLEHDYDAERRLRETGRDRQVRFISCKGLVENDKLMDQMRRMLRCIQDEYEYPVDTEFTINLSENGDYSIDLLQCRPLQIQHVTEGVAVPSDIREEDILLDNRGSSMGMCRSDELDLVVYVDPVKYYEMPYNDKSLVAKFIGKLNWEYRGKDKHMMLIVPGRIGTSSPELGVPTSFADISEFEIICETEETRAGYNPELSYGSHIFQDLVEAQILYTAVFLDKTKTRRFCPEMLGGYPDIADEFADDPKISGIVHVFDVSSKGLKVYNDIADEHLVISF